jgi:hypothetical protein
MISVIQQVDAGTGPLIVMITMLALKILATVRLDVFLQIFLKHVKLTTNVTLTLVIHLLDVFSH